MSPEEPVQHRPTERDAAPDPSRVHIVVVLGPHRGTGTAGVLGQAAGVDLDVLGATVRVLTPRTEAQTVEAVRTPCDALVLDPGSLERFSGSTADALRRLGVPVVIARDGTDGSTQAPDPPLLVTAAATASVTGGGAAAYEAAVEAAAWLAWERRRGAATPGGVSPRRSASQA